MSKRKNGPVPVMSEKEFKEFEELHDPEFDTPRPPLGVKGTLILVAITIALAVFWYQVGSWLKAWFLSL